MKLLTYNALGNIYAILEENLSTPLKGGDIVGICNALGTDGMLFGPYSSEKADFKLRIYNPDGSEAEKSGNGLRIFAKYLFETGQLPEATRSMTIETLGGVSQAEVGEGGQVSVSMGQARFGERESFVFGGETFVGNVVNVGNPHCVFFLNDISPEQAKELGPRVENDPRFAKRTNVQFVKIIDHKTIRMEIWERGAGYTLSSGSSASAAVGVFRRYFTHDSLIEVKMPGGWLGVEIDNKYHIRIKGPVEEAQKWVYCARSRTWLRADKIEYAP